MTKKHSQAEILKEEEADFPANTFIKQSAATAIKEKGKKQERTYAGQLRYVLHKYAAGELVEAK